MQRKQAWIDKNKSSETFNYRVLYIKNIHLQHFQNLLAHERWLAVMLPIQAVEHCFSTSQVLPSFFQPKLASKPPLYINSFVQNNSNKFRSCSIYKAYMGKV